MKIILSTGNVHESKLAKDLLFRIEAKAILTDKGYNTNKIVSFIKEKNSEVVVSSFKML